MPISQTSILSEIEHGKPIRLRTRAIYRRRLQNRVHRLVLRAFREQEKKAGLTQKGLAERIDSRPELINRWLGIPGNWTLNTISDLLLGIGVDLDDFSFTPIAELVEHQVAQQSAKPETPNRPKLSAAVRLFPLTGGVPDWPGQPSPESGMVINLYQQKSPEPKFAIYRGEEAVLDQ